MGEYIEDLEVGKKISNAFGIETRNKVEHPEDDIGEDRLGSDDVFGNFGITLILAIFVILLLIVIVFIVIYVSRRTELSQKNKDRLEKLKYMIFYNAIIRFAFLNALKFNMSSMVVFYKESSSVGSTFVAALLFVGFTIVVPIVLIRIVYINRASLHELQMILKYGTMYSGRRVIDLIDKRRVWIYPATFFVRRTLFATATVSLFKYPNMQMIVHQLLTMATLVYLCNDNRMFTDNTQRFTEIISEIFLLLISVLL